MLDPNTIMLNNHLVPELNALGIFVFEDKSYALDQLARLCIWHVYTGRVPVKVVVEDDDMYYDVIHHLDLLDIAFLAGKGRPPELMADRFINMMLNKQQDDLARLKEYLDSFRQFENSNTMDLNISQEIGAIRKLSEDIQEKDDFYSRIAFHHILKKAINEPFYEIISLIKSEDLNSLSESLDPGIIIYIDHLPRELIRNEDYVLGFSDAFRWKAEQLSDQGDAQIQYDLNLLIRSSYRRQDSNTLTVNQKSIYFGKTLFAMNSDPRLFELKHLSVISFLGSGNGEKIASILNDNLAKEISLNIPGENLLPGILSDTRKKKVLLLEEGLVNPNAEIPILEQLRLITKMTLSGIICYNVYKDDINKAGNEAFYDIVERLTALNQA